MSNETVWQTKLHARLHDPAEKALVLLRDPAGHEGGTSRVLWRLARADEISQSEALANDNADVLHAVAFSGGIKPATYKTVQRADWWAAAADRPQWPCREIAVTTEKGQEKTIAVADFAQVNWSKSPHLVHPLSGITFDLQNLSDTDVQDLKQRSFNHFSQLLRRDDGVTDFKKSVLAFWRFGPEINSSEEQDFGTLGPLWHLLPADTRVPDHSIWDHLDLTSAFAGAFAADEKGEAALLSLAIGPVQSFIEAARSTSDLWAGSHLLARLAWEAMKPVCEQLGPDAILFPRLRGVPQVDVWLRDECGLPADWFERCEWTQKNTDANPLFGAALPNRFVAVVPASQAKAIAEAVQRRVREWLQNLGKQVVDELLAKADLQGDHAYQQMREQLEGFPEVHWAAVPFSLIRCGNVAKQRELDVSLLSEAMRPFFSGNGEPGFLDSPAWKVLKKETRWDDNTTFFAPNPGVLYPAVHDLAERVLAAAKSTRPFTQTRQEGWRCSLTGETEWLTTDAEQLHWNKHYREQQGTLWTRLAGKFGIKEGEHLGALPAIKRLWPTLFAGEAQAATGDEQALPRFVVSTHTMALAGSLAEWIEKGERVPPELAETLAQHAPAALPRKLVRNSYAHRDEHRRMLAHIPAWLDEARESRDESVIKQANREIKQLLGKEPEAYYALLLMDGDHMGAWLSGEYAITYRDSFHPKVRNGFDKAIERQPALQTYADQTRALSPNRHLAISAALNDFSLTVARHVVEEEHMGRLIYAGGDDALAMLPVNDLLPCMQRLRAAYSGHDERRDTDWGKVLREKNTLHLKDGFAALKGKLMRMMGTTATASIGAVIAHHQAPLSAVLRELRAAEKRAKTEGERDAFSLTVIKRAGGALHLTAKWPQIILLERLRRFLSEPKVSRRAVYHLTSYLHELPDNTRDMLKAVMDYQFKRQSDEQICQHHDICNLTSALAEQYAGDLKGLFNLLSIAEFLAREIRATDDRDGATA